MVYIYSTEYASGYFCIYAPKVEGQHHVPRQLIKRILIKGGAGVAHEQKLNQKNFDPENIVPNLFTPRGVVTMVTEEDFNLLMQDQLFKKAIDNGHFSYEHDKEISIEKKIDRGDLKEKSDNAPLTPESLKPNKDNKASDKRLHKDDDKLSGSYSSTTAVEMK